jgi:hypothetical protein
MCRFSATGNDSLTTRYSDRRMKSATGDWPEKSV